MSDNKEKAPILEAGVAGASGGTLFLIIANNLPETHFIKPIVEYLAPSMSIGLSAAWLWVKNLTNEYYKKKKMAAAIRELNEKFDRYMKNPNTSEKHKRFLRKKLQELEKEVVIMELDSLRELNKELSNEEIRREEINELKEP